MMDEPLPAVQGLSAYGQSLRKRVLYRTALQKVSALGRVTRYRGRGAA